MENQQKAPFTPESLARIIKAQFPQIREISGDSFWITIQLTKEVSNACPFVKALHDYLKDFLDLHGDPSEEFQFTIERERELIDILHFGDHDAFYSIEMDLFGSYQKLRIQDVLGATSDYTIFNADFERIGSLFAVAPQPLELPDEILSDDDNVFYSDHIYPDFSNESIWKIEPESLQPYLTAIREKVLEQINANYEAPQLDTDDPEDVAFWAEQFEISEADLRSAALAAGKSIDDITTYLQK